MAVSFTSEFPVMKVERNLVMSFTNMCVMMQFSEESDDEGNGEVLTTAQICAKAEELRVAIKRKLRKCNYDKCTVPVTSVICLTLVLFRSTYCMHPHISSIFYMLCQW